MNYEQLRKHAETLRKQYPPGTRVELISMNDPFAPVESGTRGSVKFIDDAATVGSLYMFSVPRGYIDGFTGWCKQIIGLCLTAFLQASRKKTNSGSICVPRFAPPVVWLWSAAGRGYVIALERR